MKWPAPIWMCAMASVMTAAGVSAILLTPVERRREVHEPPVEQAFRRHIPQSAIARAQIADLSWGPAMESPRIVHRPPRQIDAPAADAGAEPVGYTPPAVVRGSARFEATWPQARTTEPAAAAAAAATSGGNPSAAVIPSIPSAPSSSGAAGSAPLVAIEFIGVSFGGAAMPRDDFSVGVLRDLRIRVWWNVPGPGHVQKMELIAPDGSTYQQFAAVIEDSSRGRSSRRGGALVETVLPVAGTWITEHTLLGTWGVNVYLDNAPTPAATAPFLINR